MKSIVFAMAASALLSCGMAMAAESANTQAKDPMSPKVGGQPLVGGSGFFPSLPGLPGASLGVGQPIEAVGSEKPVPVPAVSAMFISGSKRAAIVDGNLVEVGGVVSGMRVKSIDAEGIDLESGGQTVRLGSPAGMDASIQLKMSKLVAMDQPQELSKEVAAKENRSKKSGKKYSPKRSSRSGKK